MDNSQEQKSDNMRAQKYDIRIPEITSCRFSSVLRDISIPKSNSCTTPPPALTRGGAAPAAPRDLRPQVLEQLCALRPEHIPVVPNVVPRLEGAPPTAVCGGVRHSSALQAAPHGGAHSRGTVRWKALTDQIYILEFSENENGNMRHF